MSTETLPIGTRVLYNGRPHVITGSTNRYGIAAPHYYLSCEETPCHSRMVNGTRREQYVSAVSRSLIVEV